MINKRDARVADRLRDFLTLRFARQNELRLSESTRREN
jgi:hypothetical protein